GRTPESDLYSIGALLYRWIVGHDPFADEEINQLKLKYIWASPEAIRNSDEDLQSLSHALEGLLQKDPKRRKSAFAALAVGLQTTSVAAYQAPFVGRTAVIHELRTIISDTSRKPLRMVAIDGPPGMGKSRLVEQLRISSILESSVHFAVCN